MAVVLELDPTVTPRCLIPVSALQTVRFDCVCRLSVFLLVECVFLVYCVIVLCSLPGLVFWAFIYIYCYFSECFFNFVFLSLGILGFLELNRTRSLRCLIPVSALQTVRFDCVCQLSVCFFISGVWVPFIGGGCDCVYFFIKFFFSFFLCVSMAL